jgi:hypothetical protein
MPRISKRKRTIIELEKNIPFSVFQRTQNYNLHTLLSILQLIQANYSQSTVQQTKALTCVALSFSNTTFQDPSTTILLLKQLDLIDSALLPFLLQNSDILSETYLRLISSRYLEARHPVQRMHNRLVWLLHCADEKRFKHETRMSKTFFYEILNLISGHQVFQKSEERGRVQAPIVLQVVIALRRLGCYGNRSGVNYIATDYDISGLWYLL